MQPLLLLVSLLTAVAASGPREPITLEGALRVFSVDWDADSGPNRIYSLRTATGQHIQLDLPDSAVQRELDTLMPGTQLAVEGAWAAAAPADSTDDVSLPGTDPAPAPAAALLGRKLRGAQQAQQAAQGAANVPEDAPGTRFQGAALRIPAGVRRRSAGGRPRTEPADNGAWGGGVGVAGAGSAAGVLTSLKPLETDLSTIIIPIAAVRTDRRGYPTACPGTTLPKTTLSQVRRAVFEQASSPNSTSLGSLISRCSHGTARLTAASSKIEQMVQLPCGGKYYTVDWGWQDCSLDNINGWAQAADAELAARGIDVRRYRHQVYLLPKLEACRVVGLAHLGCDAAGGSCRSWIGSEHWTKPTAFIHEILHNLFLDHAGKVEKGVFDEYADDTGPMGYCCADRCPNTPHAWQLGWASLRQLDGTSLAAGSTMTVPLPSQSLRGASVGLRVVPSWAPAGAKVQPVFVGYRTQHNGDVALGASLAHRVHVYTSSLAGSYDSEKTKWEAVLQPGQSWEQPGTGLVLRVAYAGTGTASVKVCRRGGRETLASCQARRDSDCNGLAGREDPACARLLAPVVGGLKPRPSLARG